MSFGHKFNISKILKHPNFGLENLYFHNDIALVEVGSEINFSNVFNGNRFIEPICLPNYQNERGLQATLSSWNLFKENDSYPDTIQSVDIDVYPPKRCKIYKFFRSEEMICAGFKKLKYNLCNV